MWIATEIKWRCAIVCHSIGCPGCVCVCLHLHFILFLSTNSNAMTFQISLNKHCFDSAYTFSISTKFLHTQSHSRTRLLHSGAIVFKLIIRNCFYFHFIKLIDSYLTLLLLHLLRSLQRKYIQSEEKQQDVFVCLLLCVYSYSYCELYAVVSPSSRLHIARVSYVMCRQAATIQKRKRRKKPIQGWCGTEKTACEIARNTEKSTEKSKSNLIFLARSTHSWIVVRFVCFFRISRRKNISDAVRGTWWRNIWFNCIRWNSKFEGNKY